VDLTRWSIIWGALVVYIVLQKLFKSNLSKNSLDMPQKNIENFDISGNNICF
jgi:hypothetical protein